MSEPTSSTPETRPGDDVEAYAARKGSVIRGKWHIDALLGVGGMAAVYAASHRNGQRAALKVLHVDYTRDKVVCERFLREGYVSNKVGHPACVSVLDDDVTEQGEPFLVMELLEGETLRERWMKTGRRLPVEMVLPIADAILDCLAACHTIGVIHRNLKPANIFLCANGQVKVLDFGVAQWRSATSERTATGTALGTPAYMSPEQAMGLVDQLDGRADVFSVGAILHAVLTGHRINKGRTENEALVMAATTPVPSAARAASDLPVEIVALIDKALAWDRRSRFASAQAMQEAVRAALQRTSTGADVASGKTIAHAPQGMSLELDLDDERPALAPPAPRVPRPASTRPPQKLRSGDFPPEVPETDPRVVAMRDLFHRIDRVLPSVRQMGWEHPQTERALRAAFEGFAAQLQVGGGSVAVAVLPYSFVALGRTVWEPPPPFDAIPYHLFASGVRAIRARTGLTQDELKELLALFLLDPGKDLSPEDDLATTIWEKGLAHVEVDVADAFAEGDAEAREAFYTESDEVERSAVRATEARASRLEAAAMALTMDVRSGDRPAAGGPARASPLALDAAVRAVFATQLSQSRARWSERYVDVLSMGLLSARARGDEESVLASLRRSAADLVVAGRVDVVTQLHEAVRERIARAGASVADLGERLTAALFGAETLELMLSRLVADPRAGRELGLVLAKLSARELPTVLTALRGPLPWEVTELLLAYVGRVAQGREGEIARAAEGAEAAVAGALVALLAKLRTPAAREALQRLAKSDDITVRMEATALAHGSPEVMQAELAALCEAPQPEVRAAALRAIARHAVTGTLPVLLRRARGSELGALGGEERALLLRTMLALSPERAEPVALEIARRSGVFASEEREAVRLSAISALGEVSRSREVAAALREIAEARWGTSEETRAAAQAAAEAVAQRFSGTGA